MNDITTEIKALLEEETSIIIFRSSKAINTVRAYKV